MRRTIFMYEELDALLRTLAFMAPTDARRPGYLLALNAVAMGLDLPVVEPLEPLEPPPPASPLVQVKARRNQPAAVDVSLFAEPPNSPRWRAEAEAT